MEWDNKVKMIQLGNQRHNSEEAKNEFQKFVLENIDSFDGQAWDMFCNLVDLIIDEMKQNIEFWKQTLNVANYYNQLPITNTIYKENKNASINGLVESSDIVPINALHTPRVIDSKVMISVDDYFYLQNNKIGYISIYNQNNE